MSASTTTGIAFCQMAIAREEVHAVQAALLRRDEADAIERIETTIEQLEATRRLLRGW